MSVIIPVKTKTYQYMYNILVPHHTQQQPPEVFYVIYLWFDYKKAFDSVPYDQIIKELQLAKVPSKIIISISQLMKVWATKITLRAENKTTETRVINYLTGVLQGDCLSLLLFILSVNLSLGPATLFKKRLWHRCFPVNLAKFLRTPFLQNTYGRLLLHTSTE